MSSIYFFFTFLLLISRSYASFPAAYHGYSPYLPYIGVVASPTPILHAAPSFYPYPLAYHHTHRELHNIAGAIQRENDLLTDVAIRFPTKNAFKNL